MTILEMKQKRANLVTNMRALMDSFKDTAMPGDKEAEYTKMEADFDQLNKDITRQEAQLERERVMGEIEDKNDGAPKNEKRELFAKALSGDAAHVQKYQNALALGVDATAGFLTAPVEFVGDLIRGLDNVLFMRQISKVVGPIGASQSLGFPYRNTEAADATWLPEVTSAAEETTLDFGRREFKPNKMAKFIKVSKTLVRHAPMAEGVVREEMQYRIATGAENAYMNGNGTAQPLGIFIASNSGIPTTRDVATDNTATTVTFDGLQNAKGLLKQQYRGGAQWVMHRDLVKMLAKIKDGNGQYVWAGSVTAGQPDMLLGHPVNMSEYAPNTFTTGLYVAVLGNFKQGYWICDADSINIQVLLELYALTGQVGYLFDYFGDGAPVLPEAFARVKLG